MPHILLVEDQAECREPLRRLLEHDGHTVRCAENGRAALDALDDGFVPSVILLDLMMPEMDGLSFLEHLRREPRWSSLRVIVFSAYVGHVNVGRLAALGVGEILLKGSVGPAQILKLVA